MKYFDSFLNERTENLEDLSYYQGFCTSLEFPMGYQKDEHNASSFWLFTVVYK